MFKLAILSFLFIYAYGAYYEDTAPSWIHRINSHKGNWKAGFNPFLRGKSLEAMKRLMGVKKDKREDPSVMTISKPVDLATLPTSFNSATQWSKCAPTITYIKDQADCGSCWAVAASEVIEDRICISNYASIPAYGLNEPAPQIAMSAEQIMSCCNYCGDGCQGGYPIDAMRYWTYTGVVTGAWYGSNCGCQPYQIPPCPSSGCSGPEADTPKCSSTCRSGYPTSFTSDKHKATKYYNVKGATAMMNEIMTNGPIECGFDVYENFMHYTSGVYDKISGNLLGGHAVKITGWGVANGVDYWIINNSWNTTWGQNGVFWFLRGTNLAGMEEGCVAGTAKTGDSNFLLKC